MFNQVLLAGRLTKDPEILVLENGNKVTQIRIAVQRPFKSRETSEYETDFFNVSMWQGLAQTAYDNCRKGTIVIIKGRLVDDRYVDKDGKTAFSMKIIAERMTYVGASHEKEDNLDSPEDEDLLEENK